MKNEKRKANRNKSVFLVVALLFAIIITIAVGCGNPTIADDSSEVSESTSEELSTEEVASEKVAEETMDITPYTVENGKKVIDLVNDMPYKEFKVIVWRNGYGAKAILSDGDSYVLEDEDDFLILYYPNQMQNVQSEDVTISTEVERACSFDLYGVGENIEVTFTGTDVDSKEYEITVYFAKDWKYSWED